MSRGEAIARCKRTAGALVAIEYNARSHWDPTLHDIVVVRDTTLDNEWNAIALTLQRDGVPIYLRGSPTDDAPGHRFVVPSPPPPPSPRPVVRARSLR